MATYVNKLVVQDDGKLKKVVAADGVSIGGAFTAGTLAGDGSAITALSSANLVGALPAISGASLTNLNASNLASGTVPTARVSGSYTSISGVGTLTAGEIGSGFTAIADSRLGNITTVGKVANSATTAASDNTASAIVARDASGNFTAGTVTAALTGNASTASAWSASRTVSFATGDVTGSFSIDGSAAVSDVDLTIGTGVVENAMLAGSIADSKLSTISTAGKVSDSALSSNIPLLAAVTNTFTGSMSVVGSLNVTGPIISNGELNVIVHDAFLDLSAGNVGTVQKASGFSSNIKKATGFTAETATAFVAGVEATSAPTMAMSATGVLAAGDIVEISGTTSGKNDGLFVVASKTGSGGSTVVTIKGIGGTLPSANVPFVNNQFVASSAQTATVIKVDLAVFAVSGGALTSSGAAAIAAGTFCYNYQAGATESSFASTWTALNSVATPSIQDVYGAGTNGIVLATGRNFIVAKPTTGTAAISLQSNLASTFEVDGAQLDLKTFGTAADVVLTASNSVVVASPLMLPTGDGTTTLSSGVGFSISVLNGVAAGDLLYIDTDGVAKTAINTGRKAQVVALEANGGGSAAVKRVASIVGSKVYIKVSGAAPTIGDTLFLSATVSGTAVKVAPTTGLLQSFGEVIGAAIGSLYPVIYEPRVICDDLGA